MGSASDSRSPSVSPQPPDGQLRIGLTGGIGAGKSTAAAEFARLGATVIDYDALSRAVLAPGTPGEWAVFAAFPGVGRNAAGDLDRGALAEIVFGNDHALRRLESIVHPAVRQMAAQLDAEATTPIIVHDIPLLVETEQHDLFDLLVVVTAPLRLRRERLVARGMSRQDAQDRIDAQASDEERAAVADVVLDGGGTPQNLAAQVARLWQSLSSSAIDGEKKHAKE